MNHSVGVYHGAYLGARAHHEVDGRDRDVTYLGDHHGAYRDAHPLAYQGGCGHHETCLAGDHPGACLDALLESS